MPRIFGRDRARLAYRLSVIVRKNDTDVPLIVMLTLKCDFFVSSQCKRARDNARISCETRTVCVRAACVFLCTCVQQAPRMNFWGKGGIYFVFTEGSACFVHIYYNVRI